MPKEHVHFYLPTKITREFKRKLSSKLKKKREASAHMQQWLRQYIDGKLPLLMLSKEEMAVPKKYIKFTIEQTIMDDFREHLKTSELGQNEIVTAIMRGVITETIPVVAAEKKPVEVTS